MGTFNETCVLTRTPIFEGDDVRVWTVFPRVDSKHSTLGKIDTLFGIPFKAKYDGYGGFTEPESPPALGLRDEALKKNKYYRAHSLKTKSGKSVTAYIASSKTAFFMLEQKVVSLFRNEVTPYDEARKSAGDAMQNLKRLMQENFTDSQEMFQSEVEARIGKVFDAEVAPQAMEILWPVLAVYPTTLMFRESAYQALIAELAQRPLHYFGEEETEFPLRAFVQEQLNTWVLEWIEKREMFESFGSSLLYPGNQHLAPLTQHWMATAAPLISHFWEGAMPEDVIAAIPLSDLVDFFIFQWALKYLRLDMIVPTTGSQQGEVLLLKRMYDAAFFELEVKQRITSDFEDYLFRQ